MAADDEEGKAEAAQDVLQMEGGQIGPACEEQG